MLDQVGYLGRIDGVWLKGMMHNAFHLGLESDEEIYEIVGHRSQAGYR